MARKPSLVTVGRARHPFYCSVCQGSLFRDREIKLSTVGADVLRLGWANQSVTGLVCEQCGYIHMFMSAAIKLWDPDN
jgi:hypothetical protein